MAVMPKYYKIHTDGCTVELEPIYTEFVPVAVVRCRDCAHITPVEGGLPLCALHNIARAYNDFCSDGTRVGGE